MFGGITFMLGDKMCVGVIKDDLVVRVGPEHHEEALEAPHVRPFDSCGRSPRGFVFVGPIGYRTEEGLEGWVRRAVDFVTALIQK